MSKLTASFTALTLTLSLGAPIGVWLLFLAIYGQLGRFWLLLASLALLGAVLATVTWWVRVAFVQSLLVLAPATILGMLALIAVPWGWIAWSFGITVFTVLCGSAASTCHNKTIRKVGSVAGIQSTWLALFTASIYAYGHIGPEAVALPVILMVVAMILTPFIAER